MTNQIHMNNLQGHPKPHFVLVPLLAQGHMIPMVDFACLLAHRGALVSFITTSVNATRIKPTIDRVKGSELPIQFIELPFPSTKAGLPEGCENIDLVEDLELVKPFFEATRLLAEPLECFLRKQPYGPSCVISDWCQPWTAKLAQKLRIPRFVFHGPACFYLLCVHNIRKHGIYDHITDPLEQFLVPDLPNQQTLVITREKSPGFFDMPGGEELKDEAIEAEATADGLVLNTFDELERCFIESYRKAMGTKVWAVGPLSLYNKDVSEKAIRGNKAAVDRDGVISWLDSKSTGSVIYVSFGSLVRNGISQLIEIGSGLEASGHPFIWVIKEVENSSELENWLSDGFEERTRDSGLVIKGWAPQVMILSHPAVGGFVTHCGWNSTLEAVSVGVPTISWPHFGDQFLNEKLMVEVKGVGVSIGVNLMPNFLFMNNKVVLVKRDHVEKAVVNLMDRGAEGRKRRERAKALAKKAKEAMEEGGSSYENLTNLIEYVLEHQKQECLKEREYQD